MEYTAPHTPQQNGIVERQFATDLEKSSIYDGSSRFDRTFKRFVKK